jgi:hypothetical protein
MWEGPFDEFTYIDVDTIVMSSFGPLYDWLDDYAYIAGHSNIAGSRKFVWNDSIYTTGVLTSEEIEYAAGGGFFISKKNLWDWTVMERLVERAFTLRSHMASAGVDQPLLNYIVFKSGKHYTSLYTLGQADPALAVPQECWAGDPNWNLKIDGPSYYGTELKHILFVHWAGEWTLVGFERRLNRLLHRFALGRLTKTVRSGMKQKHIWNHFRAHRVTQSEPPEEMTA